MDHITTPNKCSFEMYLPSVGLWDTFTTDISVENNDPLLSQLRANGDTYMLGRMLFDTPQKRQETGKFVVYNPYTVFEDPSEHDNYEQLFGFDLVPFSYDNVSDEETEEDVVSNIPSKTGAEFVKNLLNDIYPFWVCFKRFHCDILADTYCTHEMFQKTVFYEFLFYYCQYMTSEFVLNTLIVALKDVYLGWASHSTAVMIHRYTGKQFVAIIPRGVGKTNVIKNLVVVFLVTFPGIDILASAHKKALIVSVKGDIETDIKNIFPPVKFGNYMIKNQEDSLILVRQDGTVSKLRYASAHSPDSLRGNDPHMVLQDEALSVRDSAYTIINAMGQRKKCKVAYFSSPISNKRDTLINLVRNMAERCPSVNLFRMCYFCFNPNHLQYSSCHTGCYRKIYEPRHMTYNGENKEFDGVMSKTDGSFENELGVIHPADLIRDEMCVVDLKNPHRGDKATFSVKFINHLRNPNTYVSLSSVEPHGPPESAYWIYMDPAYHWSTQSAIAIACVRYVGGRAVLCFIDRKLISHTDLGHVGSIMEEMYVKCVTVITSKTHPETRCNFFVAIERNSNADAVRTYYRNWVDLSKKFPGCNFFRYVDVYSGRRIVHGYNMNFTKSNIFSITINFLNNLHLGSFKIATTTEYGAFTRDVCAVEHLIKEIKNYRYTVSNKYSGKINPVSTDDVITCVIMAISLGYSFKGNSLMRINNLASEHISHCTVPWISMTCQCPIKPGRTK